MNTARIRQPAARQPQPAARTAPTREPTLPRANLEGLEVYELSLADWLAAGGERRRSPRTAGFTAARA